jgi:L-ascorbate metabolism protein UlaG (beta-lactamase superfamily)
MQSLSLAGSVDRSALEGGSIFFVGTATTIIRYGGFTLLTDPNFLHAGDHVHLGYGLFSRRRTNPAIDVDELPHLDACILSHMHADHWDRIARTRLRRSLPIVTTPAAARKLRRQGFTFPYGLDTWQTIELRKGAHWLRVTSMPGRHGPPVVASLLPPVMGSMLEWGVGADPVFRLYVSGDTLVHDRLREIARRYPDIPLAMLHLGGTRVVGVLVTMDAAQGVEAVRLLDPRRVIPIHYDDYTVFKSPLEDFLREADRAGIGSRVHVLDRGQTYDFEVERGRPASAPERTPSERGHAASSETPARASLHAARRNGN